MNLLNFVESFTNEDRCKQHSKNIEIQKGVYAPNGECREHYRLQVEVLMDAKPVKHVQVCAAIPARHQ